MSIDVCKQCHRQQHAGSQTQTQTDTDTDTKRYRHREMRAETAAVK